MKRNQVNMGMWWQIISYLEDTRVDACVTWSQDETHVQLLQGNSCCMAELNEATMDRWYQCNPSSNPVFPQYLISIEGGKGPQASSWLRVPTASNGKGTKGNDQSQNDLLRSWRISLECGCGPAWSSNDENTSLSVHYRDRNWSTKNFQPLLIDNQYPYY